jgi:hypothetical protein
MVYKESKQNEQEMLGNKNFYKQCKNQQLFNKKYFFFFSNFLRFHAANIKEFRSNLRATYTLNALQKTYAKKTSS